MVEGLQQTHGNAYVNQLLTPSVQRAEPATAAPAAGAKVQWESQVLASREKGDRSVANADSGDQAHLFRGDTLIIRATPQGGVDARSLAQTANTIHSYAGQNTSTLHNHSVMASQHAVEWRYTVEVGTYTFDMGLGGGDGSHHKVEANVVLDRQAFVESCSLAQAKINGKYYRAASNVKNAAAAYHVAYQQQDGVLKELGRAERVAGDIAMGLFFAVAGGAAGGAVGDVLKKYVGRIDKIKALSENPRLMAVGSITDAGKDLAKYAVRSMPKYHDLAASMPDTSGDSVAKAVTDPGVARGGREAATGADPYERFQLLEGRLNQEAGVLFKLVEEAMQEGTAAYDSGHPSEFADDPGELVERDQDIEAVASGLVADTKPYLSALWHQWLELYAYDVALQLPPAADGVPLTDPYYYARSRLSGKAMETLTAAAKSCGEDVNDWIKTYGAISEKNAEHEADRRNAVLKGH